MKLTFCGAAGIVTGSCYLLETTKLNLLIDCGLFQGDKETTRRNFEDFPFNPKKIDCLLLTHAHIDHCGLVPKLGKYGFRSPIYSTSATIDLAKLILEDSASIQETDTRYENERRARMGLPARDPLYTKEDVKGIASLFKKVEWDEYVHVSKEVSVRFLRAGHILGASSIEVYAEGKKIVFSGDIGQFGAPIIKEPDTITDADYVLIESTYGNSLHEAADRDEILLKHILETYEKGGKLLIPCFAIERTQEILYSLGRLFKAKKLPKQSVFLDSPLAIKATEIFKKHRECYNEEALDALNIFNFPLLRNTPTVKDSMKLNDYADPCIIIAGDGMCTGGRIRHHFKHGIWDKRNTVLFVGYQAEGTLGRHILEGDSPVKMMGMELAVKADIRKITSFSAHADSSGLARWAGNFKKGTRFMIIHGEKEPAQALKERLAGQTCYIPAINDAVTL